MYRKFTAEQRVDAAIRGMNAYVRTDGERLFLQRALIHVMSQVQEVRYPGDVLPQVLNVSSEGGAGLESMNYQTLDLTGEFKAIGTNATDIPEVGASMTETPNKVQIYAACYGYSQFDLERAAKARVGLSQLKGRALMLAARKKLNRLMWFGDEYVQGLFSYILNKVTIGGSWATATAQEILDDCLDVINKVVDDTEDFEADTLALDPAGYSIITTTPRSDKSDTTIAEFIKANTQINRIIKTSYLKNITNSTNSLTNKNVIMAYYRDPMILQFMTPRPLQQMPMYQLGMQFNVPAVFDCAGTFVYHPKAVAIAERT